MSTSLLSWLGGDVAIKVEADITGLTGSLWDVGRWDTAVWGGTVPAPIDITNRVLSINTARGSERYSSRFASGTLTLELDNADGTFTTGETLSAELFQPGVKIQVKAIPSGEDSRLLFTGRIVSTSDQVGPGGGDVVMVVQVVDALGELAQNHPIPLTIATGIQSTNARIETVLDNAGWDDALRLVQTGFHDVQTSLLPGSTLEELMQTGHAEGGLLYADTGGRVVFKHRDWLIGVGGVESLDDYAIATLAKDPLAYWRMSGAAATTDETGNGHTLTWNGSPTTQAAGVTVEDEAIALDGVDDYASVADDATLALRQDMAIEVWVKPVSSATDEAIIVSCVGNDILYQLDWLPSTERFRFTSSGVSGSVEFGGFVDEWQHIIVTTNWGANDRTYAIYRNGQLIQNHVVAGLLPFGTYVTLIGKSDPINLFAEVTISELAIYYYKLTPAQVAHQYAVTLSANNRSTTAQGFFGGGGSPMAEIIDIVTSRELARVFNDIQFTATDGVLQHETDATSITDFGRRALIQSFINETDADVGTLAERQLAASKELRPRIESVTLAGLEEKNSLFYDLELGDMVTTTATGLHGWVLTQDAHIYGISHSITANDWIVTYRLDDSLVEVYQSLQA